VNYPPPEGEGLPASMTTALNRSYAISTGVNSRGSHGMNSILSRLGLCVKSPAIHLDPLKGISFLAGLYKVRRMVEFAKKHKVAASSIFDVMIADWESIDIDSLPKIGEDEEEEFGY
jgi:hypothetical protein